MEDRCLVALSEGVGCSIFLLIVVRFANSGCRDYAVIYSFYAIHGEKLNRSAAYIKIETCKVGNITLT